MNEHSLTKGAKANKQCCRLISTQRKLAIKTIPKRLFVMNRAVGYWLSYINPCSLKMLAKFMLSRRVDMHLLQRFHLIRRFNSIETNMLAGHSADELLEVSMFILSLPKKAKGCIVEAGTFKGASAAKLSIIAKITGRKLYVFDSFEGLPENNEISAKTKAGYSLRLAKGDFSGSLEEVRENIAQFGEIGSCTFIKGDIRDTMLGFKEKVVACFCDVDLASSARACIKSIYPLIIPGGRFFSHDAHIPAVVALFEDDKFWKSEVGTEKPCFCLITRRFGCFERQ